MIAQADHDSVAAQIGRVPRGVVAVAARCPAGHPAVVTCYPRRRQHGRPVPFPTLYWLTCPGLCRQLAHLERDGTIALIEARLADDEVLRAALLRDHEHYIAQRWATLSAEDRQLVAAQGLAPEFESRGIGGMKNRAAVKCLHLHFAHHMVSGNAVGRLLAEQYGVRACGAG